MKWTYGIKQKATAAGILAAIMGLIIINNISERKRFRQLEESISSIYQDRLLVESYIFKLYNNLQKQNDCLLAEQSQLSNGLNELKEEREQLIQLYAQTYLTEEEELHFNALKETLHHFDQGATFENKSATNLEAIEHLNALSNIQTDEGASLWDKSERIISGSQISSQFEMAMVICLAVIIQALILSSKSLKPKTHVQKHNLN